MKDRFFITELEIPKGVPGISDLFKNVRLCNNGSLIVCYRETLQIAELNIGDRTVTGYQGWTVPAGAMLALDMRRLS